MTTHQPYTEHSVPFTRDEQKQLQKALNILYAFTLFAAGIFAIIFYSIGFDGPEVYFVGFFALFFLGVILYIFNGLYQDISLGEKMILIGKITDKQVTTPSNSKNSKSQPTYSISFGQKKFTVSKLYYELVSQGNEVEMHYAPKSKTIFTLKNTGQLEHVDHTRVIQDIGAEQSAHEQTQPAPAPFTIKAVRLDGDDIETLRYCRNKGLAWQFFYLSVVAFIGIGIYLDSPGEYPIISLIILAFLSFKAYKISQRFQNFNKDIGEGVKRAYRLRVIEKFDTVKNNMKCIDTTMGKIDITPAMFDAITVGSEIFVFTGKHSTWLIGIATKEGKIIRAGDRP